MKKTIFVIACTVACSFSHADVSPKSDISYDFFEIKLQNTKLDEPFQGEPIKANLNGIQASTSRLFAENFIFTTNVGFAYGNSLTQGSEVYNYKPALGSFGIGLGYRKTLDENLDLSIFARRVTSRTVIIPPADDAEATTAGETKVRYPITAALRYKPSSTVEFETSLTLANGESKVFVGSVFEFYKGYAIVAGYSASKSATGASVGLRFIN